MKLLLVANEAAAPAWMTYLDAVRRRGAHVEVVLLDIQPRFNRRVARFASAASRDAFRKARSDRAMAPMIDCLVRAGVPFLPLVRVGYAPSHIAAAARDQHAGEIVIAVPRRPSAAYLAGLLLSREVRLRSDLAVTLVSQSALAPMSRTTFVHLASSASRKAAVSACVPPTVSKP